MYTKHPNASGIMTPAFPTAPPLAYAIRSRRRFVDRLADFIRFPSVSAQPAHRADVVRCARWLADLLRGIGLENVHLHHTAGHPLVYADWHHAPGAPTILIYGHYDVQPADRPSLGGLSPFVPCISGDKIHGRGASDDKGQLLTHVNALEAWLRSTGRLPVNVRCVFEGEEEIGSGGLLEILQRGGSRHRGPDLRADLAILSDMPMPAPDRPALTHALRGALSMEIEVRRAGQDLHSGIFGGAIHNPLQVLCEMLAALHHADGRVAIPGFYNDVRSWSPAERGYMMRNGPSDAALLADAGANAGWGEPGYTLYERTAIRPALTINGITGGYQGPGGKGIIPAHASAKLSVRLVPDQDPWVVERLLRSGLAQLAPPTVRVSITAGSHARPVHIPRSHPALRIASRACRDTFGRPPVFLRSGGTIPIVDTLVRTLGVPVVAMGFALPDDGMHGPAEKFHLPNYFNGVAASIRFMQEVGRRGKHSTREADRSFTGDTARCS